MKEKIEDVIIFSQHGSLVLVTEQNKYLLEIEDGHLVLNKIEEK